jgi:hypothetical protein
MRTLARLLLSALLVTGAADALRGAEVQMHGLGFEHWVADTFFDGYRPSSPTQRWDIPASANKRHGGVPVNPKAAQYGHAVGLGDALRQFDIDEPFLLVIGFWRQDGAGKRFVQSLAVKVTPAQWRRLWGNITRRDLEALDHLVKDRSRTIGEVRKEALRIKALPPFSEAAIRVNPKIDRSQRRLQCSIPYDRLFGMLVPGTETGPVAEPRIFGVPLPFIPDSPPRSFAPR